jgi:hypothetical protein
MKTESLTHFFEKRGDIMEKTETPIMEEIRGTIDEIIAQIKRLIREGNARRVIVKNSEGKILFQSQLTLGVAGTAFFVLYAPVFTAITTLVLYVSDVRVFVEKEVDENRDEYEVEAEVIEIDEEEEKKEKEKKQEKDESDKTVGKKKK